MSVYQSAANKRSSSAPYSRAMSPRGMDGRFVAGPIAFQWRGFDAYVAGLEQEIVEIDAKRLAGAERMAQDMLEYAMINAPWKDRTGNARSTMQTSVIDNPEAHTTLVSLAYGVFYGLFLEKNTYKGVSYAIIKPTIDYFSQRVAEYM